jgi:hypothetical protein
MTEIEQLLDRLAEEARNTRPLFEPNVEEADHARYADAPDLAERPRTRQDGPGRYDESNGGSDSAPWADFLIRTGPTRTS